MANSGQQPEWPWGYLNVEALKAQVQNGVERRYADAGGWHEEVLHGEPAAKQLLESLASGLLMELEETAEELARKATE